MLRSWRGKRIFRFDPVAKATWTSLRLASRSLHEAATPLLFKDLTVEADGLCKIEGFANQVGGWLLEHTKQLQIVPKEHPRPLSASLEPVIHELNMRGQHIKQQLEVLERCLSTAGFQVFGHAESMELNNAVRQIMQYLPSLEYIETRRSRRFEQLITHAAPIYLEITGIVIEASNFKLAHQRWEQPVISDAHYPIAITEIMLAANCWGVQSATSQSHALWFLEMKCYSLQNMVHLELHFSASNNVPSLPLHKKGDRSSIIVLSELKALKTLALTLTNGWWYVHTSINNDVLRAHLDDILIQAAKGKYEDYLDQNHVESLESVKFCNWPVSWSSLRCFFLANASNLRKVKLERMSLTLDKYEISGQSWNEVAQFFHQNTEVRQVSFRKLTTHRKADIPSTPPPSALRHLRAYLRHVANPMKITWLAPAHVTLLHDIAATGVPAEFGPWWADAAFSNTSLCADRSRRNFADGLHRRLMHLRARNDMSK